MKKDWKYYLRRWFYCDYLIWCYKILLVIVHLYCPLYLFCLVEYPPPPYFPLHSCKNNGGGKWTPLDLPPTNPPKMTQGMEYNKIKFENNWHPIFTPWNTLPFSKPCYQIWFLRYPTSSLLYSLHVFLFNNDPHLWNSAQTLWWILNSSLWWHLSQ